MNQIKTWDEVLTPAYMAVADSEKQPVRPLLIIGTWTNHRAITLHREVSEEFLPFLQIGEIL